LAPGESRTINKRGGEVFQLTRTDSGGRVQPHDLGAGPTRAGVFGCREDRGDLVRCSKVMVSA
jgi:hypothetical protein